MGLRLYVLTVLLALPACTASNGSSPMAGDGVDLADAGLPPQVESRMDAAAASVQDAGLPQASDPTAPSATTGVRADLSASFQAELAALLAFKRKPFADGMCPGLLQAGGCGNGQCELGENKESCAADCVPHLIGAYNDLPICPDYQVVVTAHSVSDVQSAVRRALAAGQHVRAVGARHSASAAICGDGMAIDMSEFADLSTTRITDNIAYVQPGVRMIDLGDYLAERGLGIGYTHLGFRGVTVAGAMGTSAHGSSPRHTNTISHRVAAITMVLADGTLRTFREEATDSDLWRALTTHLGLLGIIVEVGLRVEPSFQLDTEITLIDEQTLLQGAGALALLDGCDWGQMNWFPHNRQAFRWCGKASQGAAQRVDNTLLDPGVGSEVVTIAKSTFHAGTCDLGTNAFIEDTRFSGLKDHPPLTVTNTDGTRTNTTHAVGPAHRMMSADLIRLGKDKYFQMDWEVAIPQQYIQDALQTARKVFDAHNVSLPGVGVFVRFGKIERGSWLSYHSAGREFAEGQTAMFFETPVAVPAGYSEEQLGDYLHVYQELISLFVRHFGARAHWGKNLDAIFELQHEVGTYAGRIEKMNEAVAQLDPRGVFANAFARRIGVRWPEESARVASAP